MLSKSGRKHGDRRALGGADARIAAHRSTRAGKRWQRFAVDPNAPRRAYLDPNWVGARARDYHDRRLDDFACAVVDDMLDQSHRIALRKLIVKPDGRLEMPSKLYEREGRYFADSAEGADNIGYRDETLGAIATEFGLLTNQGEALRLPISASICWGCRDDSGIGWGCIPR